MATTVKLNKYGTDLNAVSAAVHPGQADSDIVDVYCWKCGGEGYIEHYSFVESGRCFACNATGGHHTTTVGADRKKARRDATTRDRKAALLAAELAAEAAAREFEKDALTVWREANQGIVEFLAPHSTGFLGEMSERIASERLTEKQLETVVRIMADVEAAGTVPVTDERVKLAGTILSMRLVADRFSYVESYTAKVIVRLANGARVYGTAPRGFAHVDDLVGSRVEFMAKVEAAKDDATFGFFSRPTKAVYEHLALAA